MRNFRDFQATVWIGLQCLYAARLADYKSYRRSAQSLEREYTLNIPIKL